MLRTLPQTRDYDLTKRLVAVAVFVVLMIVSARVQIYLGSPVPFTLQVLVVLLSGMVLGARDGALVQISYISMIVAGIPVDTNAIGAAAFFGPTGGYLIGFIPAAFAAGWLVQHGANRVWQRWIAGMVGVAIIYLFGLVLLKTITGLGWSAAWAAGVVPFLGLDMVKALIAAGAAEGARSIMLRGKQKDA